MVRDFAQSVDRKYALFSIGGVIADLCTELKQLQLTYTMLSGQVSNRIDSPEPNERLRGHGLGRGHEPRLVLPILNARTHH